MLQGFLDFCTQYGYLGLFLAAFIAGSVIPMSSEVVMTALLQVGAHPWLCVLSATAGNVCGGMTCYLIGRAGKTEWIARFFKVKPKNMDKAMRLMNRYGVWAAFFAFVPYIGTAIVISLGLMRASWVITLLMMTLGKMTRYLVLWAIVSGIFTLF